jgi:DNA-binding FadR family transcriptional regulator
MRPGELVRLTPGESICLPPRTFHQFWGETGTGPSMSGEVSSVCNDRVESAKTVEERAEADLDFHKDILAIAGNPILTEFGSFLGRFFMEAQYLTDESAAFGTAAAHRALIGALNDRDAARAKDIVTVLLSYMSYMRAQS